MIELAAVLLAGFLTSAIGGKVIAWLSPSIGAVFKQSTHGQVRAAFKRGMTAHLSGESRRANPHMSFKQKLATPVGLAWDDGWQTAAEQARDGLGAQIAAFVFDVECEEKDQWDEGQPARVFVIAKGAVIGTIDVKVHARSGDDVSYSLARVLCQRLQMTNPN